ncbi:FAD-dependent monooxygenase [Alteromonas sp. H39]|uniref:FAD-dependent monooxygenase n=1 Tax=Alteromonas sp. H39 TaxID=3389876 RepID=UPI0039E17E71
MQNVDVLIVGGGMVGLSLVSALKNTELSVAIVSDTSLSQTLPDSPTVRVSAINKRNADKLNALEVWQHIPQSRLCAYTQMAVWDKDSFGRIAFDAADTQTENLGHIVENQALVNALATQVRSQANVTVTETTINRILWGDEQTVVMLENNDAIACKLLVGADGANSFVRNQAAFPLTFKDYGHTAIVANLRCDEPHGGVARQVFTPSGPLALLPMADPNLVSIVWSQEKDNVAALLDLDDNAFCAALVATCNAALGTMSLDTERFHFPLVMRYARQWLKQGGLILGDAAHTIHPLAGQGANLGMQDAFALAEILSELEAAGKPIHRTRYLRPWERARKAEAVKMIAAMEGFKQLFGGDDPLKKLIRGVGLVATDSLPGLKDRWVAQAMGL